MGWGPKSLQLRLAMAAGLTPISQFTSVGKNGGQAEGPGLANALEVIGHKVPQERVLAWQHRWRHQVTPGEWRSRHRWLSQHGSIWLDIPTCLSGTVRNKLAISLVKALSLLQPGLSSRKYSYIWVVFLASLLKVPHCGLKPLLNLIWALVPAQSIVEPICSLMFTFASGPCYHWIIFI